MLRVLGNAAVPRMYCGHVSWAATVAKSLVGRLVVVVVVHLLVVMVAAAAAADRLAVEPQSATSRFHQGRRSLPPAGVGMECDQKILSPNRAANLAAQRPTA